MELEWGRGWKKLFASTQQRLKNPFENERTSELWVFKSIVEVCVFQHYDRVCEKKAFIYVGDQAQKWLRNGVWFES